MTEIAGIRHLIHPSAVYDRDAARKALKLKKSTLTRELRLGRLRCSKRAGRVLILGQWLLEWIESGEIKPAKRDDRNGQTEHARTKPAAKNQANGP